MTGGAKLEKKMFGKPTEGTFQFAEERLRQHRDALLAEVEEGNLNKEAAEERKKAGGLKTVYMVGDNPESDIRGANEYQSPTGSEWHSILVRSGVYIGGDAPAYEPRVIVDDVWDAVKWAMECEDMSLEQDEGQG